LSRIFEIITPDGNRHFSDSDLPLAIGTGNNAHIPLAEGEKETAWVADSRGYLFLQATETNVPVYHNDEQLQGSTWIKSGDTTRIGQTLVHWIINGDRVEIRTLPADALPLTPPPGNPHFIPEDNTNSLPRVEASPEKSGRKLHWLLLLSVLLLALAAFFVLTAQHVELTVQPEPDTLTVAGFPPMVKIGHSFLALGGTYTLHAEKVGYQPLSELIIVKTGNENRKTFILKKLPGKITIKSRPVSGAKVLVDGNPIGETPVSEAEIASGNHLLRLEKKRYLSLEKQLVVNGGGEQQEEVVELQPGWGTVTLTSTPAGATVSQGEQVLGTTPLTVELMAGNVLLTFDKKGYSATALEFIVEAGQPLTPETIRLEPAPAKVIVRSDPAGAMVSVNTAFAGTTPVTLSLPSGVQQNIHLQLAGFKPAILRREFIANTVEEIPVSLQPLYGTILLSTDPVEATLLIDGKKYGPATGKLRLPARKHTLTVQAKGFETATRTVLPKEGISQQLEIRLQKKGTVTRSTVGQASETENDFIRLGPATVQLGAASREAGRRANEQQRTVQLSRPFFLAARPVTNHEFRSFNAAHRSEGIAGLTLDGSKQPVVNVSWEDAARYCNWLSAQKGLPEFYRKQGKSMVAISPANNGYRLPTEAEWAFAARMAGRQQPARYPWAGKFPPVATVANFGDESARGVLPMVIRGYNDGFPVTSPVGSFQKNPGGFFDLGGNISQWCHDWYTPYAVFGKQKPLVDPLGPPSGTHHVVKGSSWRDATITTLRLSYRGYSKTAKDDIGFRVARYIQ